MTIMVMVRWHNLKGVVMNRIDVSEFKGPLDELIDQCSGEENGRQRFEEFKLWLKGVFPKLLSLVTTVSVSAYQRFAMKDNLESANIGWTGDNFKRVMLDKIEENVPAGEVNIYRLEKDSLDPEIMAEMGPEKRVTYLAHFIERIKKQSKGQPGSLKVDGSVNVAYIEGTDGNVWAVCALWRSRCRDWLVEAHSVVSRIGWGAGRQFLSSK